jgi:hypothetical protein
MLTSPCIQLALWLVAATTPGLAQCPFPAERFSLTLSGKF